MLRANNANLVFFAFRDEIVIRPCAVWATELEIGDDGSTWKNAIRFPIAANKRVVFISRPSTTVAYGRRRMGSDGRGVVDKSPGEIGVADTGYRVPVDVGPDEVNRTRKPTHARFFIARTRRCPARRLAPFGFRIPTLYRAIRSGKAFEL